MWKGINSQSIHQIIFDIFRGNSIHFHSQTITISRTLKGEDLDLAKTYWVGAVPAGKESGAALSWLNILQQGWLGHKGCIIIWQSPKLVWVIVIRNYRNFLEKRGGKNKAIAIPEAKKYKLQSWVSGNCLRSILQSWNNLKTNTKTMF